MIHPRPRATPPKVMTVAGSDSGGGAGIQADLKTFAALGVYGSSILTAVTAQNTRGVSAVHGVPPEFVAAQLDAVLNDIGAAVVKTGMLASAPIIEAVAERLTAQGIGDLVVDPVMVAKSGHRLLEPEAVAALTSRLLPLALVVTPNIPEATVLSGRSITSDADAHEAAIGIAALGPRFVVVKGGHRAGDPVDLVYDGRGFTELHGDRVDTRNTHGTGDTFASAIVAFLAHGVAPLEAMAAAKRYLEGALRASYPVGGGHSPVHHFHAVPIPVPSELAGSSGGSGRQDEIVRRPRRRSGEGATAEEQEMTATAASGIGDLGETGSLPAALWASIGPTYRAILTHPFLTGLTDGALPEAAFRSYVVQDALYLDRFARALSVAAARAPRRDDTALLNRHALGALAVERSLHEGFVADFGLAPEDAATTPLAPATLAYTSYLLAVAHGGTFAEALGALLPCYWIYLEVGQELLAKGSPHPLYGRWITTYAGDEYAAVVREVLALTERVGRDLGPAERASVEGHFATAARYEWMFWDAAWRGERWPADVGRVAPRAAA